ncbi:PAS domain-containing protein [Mucilaginibacter calamicampi]|uniref:histidine kinase n=1 Tax=Mucilaginibacter calamicampi TaxID=1302352 RepID=A0ABW2Z4X5_9SPHI
MIIENDPSQLYSLLQSIGAIVWNADMGMQRFFFIDEQVSTVLGVSPDEWLQTPGFWEARIHPDDRGIIEKYKGLNHEAASGQVFEYRMIAADGTVVWIRDTVSIAYNEEDGYRLCGVMLDISVTERLQVVENLERNILRLNSDLSVSLTNVLMAYLKGLEELFPQMSCSIHRIANRRLTEGLAPSLPVKYMEAISGIAIGENVGSCGAAATLKQQVIVSDIATDRRWQEYTMLAEQHGLAACWANPVINADGKVIAVLGMYYNQPKSPGREELKVMEKATALLRIILENRQQTEVIRDANLLMLQSQELAHFGNWRWDIVNDVVSWSPALYTIYGLDQHNFKATFAGYLERLHPDDHDRIYRIIKQVLDTGEGAEFDERVFRPDGSLRYLRSWAKLKTDSTGRPLEMIGACLDNTEKVLYATAVEQQSRQLLDIAWLQSHAIRSPLVRIMGIADLLCNMRNSEEEQNKLMAYLMTSARELDEQVRLISYKTESAG